MNPEGMQLSTEAHWYVPCKKGVCQLCDKKSHYYLHRASCCRCTCQSFLSAWADERSTSESDVCIRCLHYRANHSANNPHYEQPKMPQKAPGSSHYQGMPGPEPIEVTKHMDFLRGNVVKYVMRAGRKGGPADERLDLEKAAQYLAWAIEMLPAKGE